jgi:protocatechuate 3,4-dioxygenase beta subunit
VTYNLHFTPDGSGTYSIAVAAGSLLAAYDDNSDLMALTNAEIYANLVNTTFTVATSGSPTTVALAAVTTGAPKSSANGAIWKVTLSDATGAATLGSSEQITLSSSSTTVTFAEFDGTAFASANNTILTAGDFSGGVAYIQVKDTVAETVTITATGSGILSTAVTATATYTAGAAITAAPVASIGKSALNLALVAGTTAAPAQPYSALTTSASQTIRITDAVADVIGYDVTDTNGKVTGKIGAKYSKSATSSVALGYVDVAIPATLKAGEAIIVALVGSTGTITTTTITGAASTSASVTVADANRRVALLSATTFVATVKDGFGAVRSGVSVTATVTGRNAATASTLVTGSDGKVSFTVTDAGTTGTSDTVTFTATVSATGTITYGSTDATTVTLEGPNFEDTQITLSDMTGINAAKAGAAGTTATVTAEVLDANGVGMAGVPVTFTVAGTTAAILSTKVTVYTGAAGTAASSVYAWKSGAYVVTATAGGKSATDTVHFAQTEPTYARTIAATVSGATVTATVLDRYGNAVPNVTVWATKTGTGYFGSGSSTASGTTNAAGTVDFYLNGSASVKVALGSTSAADTEYGQSSSAVGYVCQDAGCTTALTTAATVGTSTTAETGVGASLAPAGVNSATVSVEAGVTAAETAADAAAEATDAANAATDAANAAAEAADAATAAAQDAADAVAALSAQVATLISGLKSQLTALTNLVIKIQKKVKA